MTPLKVVEPPAAQSERGRLEAVIGHGAPAPGPLSDSEATVWGVPLRSSTAPAEICTGLALGKLPTLLKYSCVTWAWVTRSRRARTRRSRR